VKSKFSLIIAAIFILFAAIFFSANKPYRLAFEAKFYYQTGDFKKAFELSSEAMSLDAYNKMAATLVNQSRNSLKFRSYLDDGERYASMIKKMSLTQILPADKKRILLMCDVMIEGYGELPNSPLVGRELKNDAKNMKENFARVKNELF